ncbi:MAG: redoxin domain-containing protein [Pseudomonadota bacterium]|nr:redoxin domain-containing protein [Pseudomonadota bacterium]
MTSRLVTVAAAALLWIAAGGVGHTQDELRRVDIGRPAPLFSARGADGRPHRLADYAGKVVVLEWTSPVCPYTEIKYKSGAMQALQRQARRMGAVWLSIDTAAADRPGYLSPKAAKAGIRATHAVVTAFLSDPDGKIGRAYGAKTTPTLYIIGKDGRLAYQGALDDDPSSADFKGKTYVQDALDDLAVGKPVRVAESRTYGCAVEY